MDASGAAQTLAALAQETRIGVFRLLVSAGPGGLPAGEVARRLGVPHNTMSAHLATLSRAGLVAARREGRLMIYAAELDGLRRLIGFLLAECCGGRPELCADLLDTALTGAAPCPEKAR